MTYEWQGDNPPPEFDNQLADSYIGKYILIGITYFNKAGDLLEQIQIHGVIESVNTQGLTVSLKGKNSGESWIMPPMLEAIQQANPGLYSLHTTGEEIENPDLLSTWSVTRS
jgi:hypothetical protein